jgi:hypothetical protein
MLADKDGSHSKTIGFFDLSMRISDVSSDGRQMLIWFPVPGGCTLLSLRSDGSYVRRILEWHGAFGDEWFRFSHGDRYVLFNQTDGSQSDIWALPLKAGIFHHSSQPIRLTSGPLSYTNPFPSPDGKRLFAIGTKPKAELVRYRPATREFLPWRPGLSAIQIDLTADGEWMVYVSYPDLSVWRSRTDGTEQLQLTFPPMKAARPRFSPDGKRIAFSASYMDNLDNTYLVDITGGPPAKIANLAFAPEWSPDGSSIVVNEGYLPNNAGGLSMVNFATGEVSRLLDDPALINPKFVDAKTLVGLDPINGKFAILDLSTHRRSDLLSLSSSPLAWRLSSDRRFLYYSTGGNEVQIHRVALLTKKEETVTDLQGFHTPINPIWHPGDFAMRPDGSIIFSRDIGSQEIYALNVRWP